MIICHKNFTLSRLNFDILLKCDYCSKKFTRKKKIVLDNERTHNSKNHFCTYKCYNRHLFSSEKAERIQVKCHTCQIKFAPKNKFINFKLKINDCEDVHSLNWFCNTKCFLAFLNTIPKKKRLAGKKITLVCSNCKKKFNKPLNRINVILRKKNKTLEEIENMKWYCTMECCRNYKNDKSPKRIYEKKRIKAPIEYLLKLKI